MSAPADLIHVHAHRAVTRRRDVNGWWGSPLDTALGAVAATIHPPDHREAAEQTVDQLLRWFRAGQVRPTSADATALALTARAAASLARHNPELLADAVTAVDQMATRDISTVPDLHVALAAWALDDLQPDRTAAPWPAIRHRTPHRRSPTESIGVDAALCAYLTNSTTPSCDPRAMAQHVLASSTPSPAAADIGIVLWLLTITIDRASRDVAAEDPSLVGLTQMRADLLSNLADKTDESSFRTPEEANYDPDAVSDNTTAVVISSTEALLVDIALASADRDQPWLRFSEAEALFGQRAREQAMLTRSWIRRAGLAIAAGGLAAGAAVALALTVAGVDSSPAIGFGTAMCAGLCAWAGGIWQRTTAAAVARSTTVLCTTLTLVALLVGGNSLLAKPLFTDTAGLAGGALITTVATVFAALLGKQTSNQDNT